MRIRWHRLFETEKTDTEHEDMTLKDIVMRFITTFAHQTAQYKIVWIVRIICWILILTAGLFGLVIRITTHLK